MKFGNYSFRLATTFICLMVFYAYTNGQTFSSPSLKHYSVVDGLPSSEVYSVLEDKNGFLWFATDMGAVRYNGYEFKTFGLKEGLPDNSVLSLFEDYKGRIWFITYSCKLAYYYNDTVSEYSYNSKIPKENNFALPDDFAVDSLDNVYFGVYFQGYFKISKDGLVQHLKEPYQNIDCDIIQIDSKKLFTGIKSTSVRKNAELVLNFKTSLSHSNFVLKVEDITTHYKSVILNNEIVSFFTNSIFKVNGNQMQSYPFDSRILVIYPDSGAGLWIGKYKEGVSLCVFKNEKLIEKKSFLKGLTVTSIYKDFEGGTWFTTHEDGVFYLPSLDVQAVGAEIIPPGTKITSMVNRSGYIYATTNSNKIYKIKGAQPIDIKVIPLTVDDDSYLHESFYDTSTGRIMLQSFASMSFLDLSDKQNRFSVAGGSGDVIKDRISNNFITGTFKGLYKTSVAETKQINYDQESFRATALAQTLDGSYLIGGVNGLFTLNKDSLLTLYNPKNKLLQSRVTCITSFNDSVFAIGTHGNGLLIICPDSIQLLSTKDGLLNDNINHISVEGNNIYISTNTGLSILAVNSIAPLNFKINNFTSTDGLFFQEINCSVKYEDKLYLGTNKGVFFIEPDSFKENSTNPLISLESIKVNGTLVKYNGFLDLKPDENNLAIRVVGLSYRSQRNISYKYKIEGQDSSWRFIKNRQLDFVGLNPGNYKLIIKAVNAAGIISANSLQINFRINEKIYQTLWFKLLAILLTGFAIYLFLRQRIASLKKKQMEKVAIQKTIADLELKALRAQMNPHFTFNVLNSISYFITHNDNVSAQKYLTRFSRLIRLILDHSKTDFNSLENEIKLLNIYLELESLRFEERFSFSIEVDKNVNILKAKVPSMFIQPFIENAIKHGLEKKKGKGTVNVSFVMEGDMLKCTILDNGIGRRKSLELKDVGDENHLSISTEIANERVKSFNIDNHYKLSISTFDLDEIPGFGTGTKVVLQIPQTLKND